MHPKIAERIARCLHVQKRKNGVTAVSAHAHRIMGYCGSEHPDYLLVKGYLDKYKGNLNVKDTQ